MNKSRSCKLNFNQQMKRKVTLQNRNKKKINAATSRILKKEVNAEAARKKTCCIWSAPTLDCNLCTTCNIHMEPNEWLRFLYKLESISRNATMDHFKAPVLYKHLGKGQKVLQKKDVVGCTLHFQILTAKSVQTLLCTIFSLG